MKKSKQVPWVAWTGNLEGSGWWPGTRLQSRGCRSGPWSSLASGTCHQTRALITMNSSTRIQKKVSTSNFCFCFMVWTCMSDWTCLLDQIDPYLRCRTSVDPSAGPWAPWWFSAAPWTSDPCTSSWLVLEVKCALLIWTSQTAQLIMKQTCWSWCPGTEDHRASLNIHPHQWRILFLPAEKTFWPRSNGIRFLNVMEEESKRLERW